VAKRIFLITTGRLRAFHFDGQLSEPIEFAANEQGLTDFSQYLEHYPTDPVAVLVDVVEEDFREESIPHVFGGDRQAVLATKLNRIFRDTTYSNTLFQGRETEGRRDDRVLFTALIRPDLLAPWMGQLSKHKTSLAGIYSLPLLSGQLCKQLKIEHQYLLLVSLQSSGGLRQTYIQDGQLRVSRLAVLPDSSPEKYSAVLLNEIERFRRYLNSLRLLPSDEALDVYILGTDRVREEVERHTQTSITAHHHVLSLRDVARKLGIKGEFSSRFSDQIFTHLLARNTPPNQYAPASQIRYFRLYKLRRALIAASILILIVGLGWSAANFVDGLTAIQDTQSVRRQAGFYQVRYDRARARLPETPADTRIMQNVVEAAQELKLFKVSPLDMMSVLSTGLEAFPDVVLTEINWSAQIRGNSEVVAGNLNTGSGALPGADDGLSLRHHALIKARIKSFDGDYRKALETVRRFAEHLRQIPGVAEVRVESLPLDIGPEASLSGNVEAVNRNAKARFSLGVALQNKGGSSESG